MCNAQRNWCWCLCNASTATGTHRGQRRVCPRLNQLSAVCQCAACSHHTTSPALCLWTQRNLSSWDLCITHLCTRRANVQADKRHFLVQWARCHFACVSCFPRAMAYTGLTNEQWRPVGSFRELYQERSSCSFGQSSVIESGLPKCPPLSSLKNVDSQDESCPLATGVQRSE